MNLKATHHATVQREASNGGGDRLCVRRGCEDDLGAAHTLKFGRRIGRGAVDVSGAASMGLISSGMSASPSNGTNTYS